MPDDGIVKTSPPPPSPEDIQRYALDLVQTFNDEADNAEHQGPFHPVLIFGSGGSGKSLALTSMFIFTRGDNEAHINCQFMEFNYPASCPYDREDYKNAALRLFNGDMVKPMIDGRAHVDASREPYPFFLPIQATFQQRGLKRSRKSKVARFMFLESLGEWIHKDANGFRFLPFKPEIAAVLEHFNKPLTAIFVAPVASDEQLKGEEVIKSHEALAHAMEEFSRLRKHNNEDNLLLLATKWDQKFPPNGPNGEAKKFSDPTSELVIEALSKYKFSWPAFDTMAGVPEDSQWLLPYAAMWIRNEVRTEEGDHKRAFGRFKRTLWNWLYGNSFSATNRADGSKRGPRKHFYPDCSPNAGSALPSYSSVMRRIVRIAGF